MYTISNLAASDSKSKKPLLMVKLGTIEISAKRTIVRWGLILGCHVTSEKIEIKNFKFLPLSGQSYFETCICWPVFSSIDRLSLKIEHGFFTMRDIGIVSGQHVTCTEISICLMFSSSE